MTREEAIAILSEKIKPCVLGEWDEATDMAIKALETQNNCIICPRCGREFSEYEGREQTNDE